MDDSFFDECHESVTNLFEEAKGVSLSELLMLMEVFL